MIWLFLARCDAPCLTGLVFGVLGILCRFSYRFCWGILCVAWDATAVTNRRSSEDFMGWKSMFDDVLCSGFYGEVFWWSIQEERLGVTLRNIWWWTNWFELEWLVQRGWSPKVLYYDWIWMELFYDLKNTNMIGAEGREGCWLYEKWLGFLADGYCVILPVSSSRTIVIFSVVLEWFHLIYLGGDFWTEYFGTRIMNAQIRGSERYNRGILNLGGSSISLREETGHYGTKGELCVWLRYDVFGFARDDGKLNGECARACPQPK